MRNRLFFILAFVAFAAHLRAATTRPSTQPALPAGLDGADTAGDLGGVAGSPGTSPELGLYQDIPVVVAASKYAETIHQAPASVSVVTDNDIELFNYRSLADVLRNQRSFYLDTDGLNWFAGARGFLRAGEWNSRLLVLVDDRPTNEIIFGQTHLDMDFVLPMEAVKQVEIIRGPGSALYGTDSVFGVINVVSKNGSDVNGAEVKMEGGTQNSLHANALVGLTPDGWDILADFSAFTTDGEDHIHYDGVDDPAHNYGNIDNSDNQAAYDGYFKAQKGEFTAEMDFASRRQDNDAATYLASFTDPGTMYEQRVNTTFRVDHDMGNDQSLHVMAYYGHYGYDQNYGVAASAPHARLYLHHNRLR
jgi:outer membrane receptor for ferrienterochelin and colicins